MKILGTYLDISINRSKELYSTFNGYWHKITDSEIKELLEKIYRIARKRTMPYNLQKLQIQQTCIDYNMNSLFISMFGADNNVESFESIEVKEAEDKSQESNINPAELETQIDNMINFFSEFQFTPNFRFINTYCLASNKKAYIMNYMALSNNVYINEIQEKMKSEEFKRLDEYFRNIKPSKKINNRLKIYFGDQGTGKTTKAMKESNNVVMVCHSGMLPNDLMEDFKFEDGKATFKKSVLYEAMENGTTITLDEINLLPFESLRFLQSILDNKTEITYKDKQVKIKDGFKIIGTMNLQVNNTTFSLPEPLVDRCEEIKEFKLKGKDLINAII